MANRTLLRVPSVPWVQLGEFAPILISLEKKYCPVGKKIGFYTMLAGMNRRVENLECILGLYVDKMRNS